MKPLWIMLGIAAFIGPAIWAVSLGPTRGSGAGNGTPSGNGAGARSFGELLTRVQLVCDRHNAGQTPSDSELRLAFAGDVLAVAQSARLCGIVAAKLRALIERWGPDGFAVGDLETPIGPLTLTHDPSGLRVAL